MQIDADSRRACLIDRSGSSSERVPSPRAERISDLADLTSRCFVSTHFGRLESITLGAAFKLRKIFTLREPPGNATVANGIHFEMPLPRGFELPPGTVSTTLLFSMHRVHRRALQKLNEDPRGLGLCT